MRTLLMISKDTAYMKQFQSRMNEQDIRFFSAEGAEQALHILAENSIDLLVVDAAAGPYEELLRTVKMRYPDTVRFSVNEQSNTVEQFLSMRKTGAQVSCSRQLNAEEVIETLKRVIGIHDKVQNKALMELVSELKHLPTIPHIYYELSEMIEANASVEEIASKLEEDPAITSNILKMANTAFYNAKTGSIRHAIMYIGLTNVKNIILTNSVFGNEGLDPKIRNLHWEHVRLANKLLNVIYADFLGKKLNNNISAVGLLHDVGSIVLMMNFPSAFNQIAQSVNDNPDLAFEKMEHELIGFDHQEVGGYLLNLWGLPYPMIEAAVWHHDPLNPGIINRELVMAMHLANHYAWKCMGYEKKEGALKVDVFEALGVTQAKFDDFYDDCNLHL